MGSGTYSTYSAKAPTRHSLFPPDGAKSVLYETTVRAAMNPQSTPDDGAAQAQAQALDVARALKPSHNRAAPIRLPADPLASAALVLRYVQTAEVPADRSAAIEAMTARVSRLTDPNADASTVVAELAAHAAVLDALFQRWATEAVRAAHPEHRTKFAKLALSSQASYTRTLVAIEGLKAQAKGRGRVVVHEEGDGDGADHDSAGFERE